MKWLNASSKCAYGDDTAMDHSHCDVEIVANGPFVITFQDQNGSKYRYRGIKSGPAPYRVEDMSNNTDYTELYVLDDGQRLLAEFVMAGIEGY